MTDAFLPQRLDVPAFARTGAEIGGEIALGQLTRLAQESPGGTPVSEPVRWTARGEQRAVRGGQSQDWLHLGVSAVLPLACQRCLQPVLVPLSVERSFRFVADEATAMAEDDASEEDLLVLSRRFDLAELIEDELLMAIPLVPRHEACPSELPRTAGDIGLDMAPKPNPFAALAKLRG